MATLLASPNELLLTVLSNLKNPANLSNFLQATPQPAPLYRRHRTSLLKSIATNLSPTSNPALVWTALTAHLIPTNIGDPSDLPLVTVARSKRGSAFATFVSLVQDIENLAAWFFEGETSAYTTRVLHDPGTSWYSPCEIELGLWMLVKHMNLVSKPGIPYVVPSTITAICPNPGPGHQASRCRHCLHLALFPPLHPYSKSLIFHLLNTLLEAKASLTRHSIRLPPSSLAAILLSPNSFRPELLLHHIHDQLKGSPHAFTYYRPYNPSQHGVLELQDSSHIEYFCGRHYDGHTLQLRWQKGWKKCKSEALWVEEADEVERRPLDVLRNYLETYRPFMGVGFEGRVADLAEGPVSGGGGGVLEMLMEELVRANEIKRGSKDVWPKVR